jgi:hypothetical protein
MTESLAYHNGLVPINVPAFESRIQNALPTLLPRELAYPPYPIRHRYLLPLNKSVTAIIGSCGVRRDKFCLKPIRVAISGFCSFGRVFTQGFQSWITMGPWGSKLGQG